MTPEFARTYWLNRYRDGLSSTLCMTEEEARDRAVMWSDGSLSLVSDDRATPIEVRLVPAEVWHKVVSELEYLWWSEYDSLGADFVFDAVERALTVLGAPLPNAEHGGRAVKWPRKEAL